MHAGNDESAMAATTYLHINGIDYELAVPHTEPTASSSSGRGDQARLVPAARI